MNFTNPLSVFEKNTILIGYVCFFSENLCFLTIFFFFFRKINILKPKSMRVMIGKEIEGVFDLSALMLTTFYIEILNGGFQNGALD